MDIELAILGLKVVTKGGMLTKAPERRGNTVQGEIDLATAETVGSEFSQDKLLSASARTLSVIREAASLVRPGMLESEARKLVAEIQAQHGAPKSWHPSQIRFGENTLLSFGKKGLPDPALGENDIFFFDIGPIFDGHEGDVGRTFAVGDDREMRACGRDVEILWHLVRERWISHSETGAELYAFATERAHDLGWILSLDQANGHRISDFPHAARSRGSIEKFPQKPAPHRWILEIQIRHPRRNFGAFFEDLLA